VEFEDRRTPWKNVPSLSSIIEAMMDLKCRKPMINAMLEKDAGVGECR
jgi:hypothetical protein